jgi:hypothetical protein
MLGNYTLEILSSATFYGSISCSCILDFFYSQRRPQTANHLCNIIYKYSADMFVKGVLGQDGAGHYEVPHHSLHVPCLALRSFYSRIRALICKLFLEL